MDRVEGFTRIPWRVAPEIDIKQVQPGIKKIGEHGEITRVAHPCPSIGIVDHSGAYQVLSADEISTILIQNGMDPTNAAMATDSLFQTARSR